MFHIGQMVVCVDGSFCGHTPWKAHPPRNDAVWVKTGLIYTITGIGNFLLGPFSVPVLHVEEAFNPSNGLAIPKGADLGFAASRFRPVRTTSIKAFTALLNKTPERTDA